MSTPRLAINVGNKEVERPSGGGKGPDVPYHVTVLIDGEAALFLTTSSFKAPGQMEKLIEIIEGLARS